MAEAKHYRFAPENLPDGIYDSPHFGELIPGRVAEIPPEKVHLVAYHPDWEKATRKQYEDQPDLEVDKARFRQPTTQDEEE